MMRDIPALIAFLDARADMPHIWGRAANDCVAFVCGAVEAQTGRHPLPIERFGDWRSRRGAVRLLRRHGGLKQMTDEVFTPIAPALAMRGDIAAVADDRLGIALLIVEGATLVGPGALGATRLPRSVMMLAWSAVETADG